MIISDELKERYNEHKSYVISKLKEKFNLTDEETIRYFYMTYEKKVIGNCIKLMDIPPAPVKLKKLYPELS